LDYDILGRNADIFVQFERGEVYKKSEIEDFDEKLLVFLTEIIDDNDSLFELNAIGQLYLTSFRLRYPKVIKLVSAKSTDRSEPSFGKKNKNIL
jgi:hypothetical protein